MDIIERLHAGLTSGRVILSVPCNFSRGYYQQPALADIGLL